MRAGLGLMCAICAWGQTASSPPLAAPLQTAHQQAAPPALALMPWPAEINVHEGSLRIGNDFAISLSGAGAADGRVKDAARRTVARLARQTGLPLAVEPPPADKLEAGKALLSVVVEKRDRSTTQHLGDDESYALLISADRIRLSADAPLGALRGFETFLQLVGPCAGDPAGFCVPLAEIHDQPRFPWRGLSLDVSRHFIPVDEIKRTIDGLAAVKLNVLHWHLSDDQGFRVESRRYPGLQQRGSDGQYYTQAEIREVVGYARDRGVRIVPEFDVPGHSTSWLAAYPYLASKPGKYSIVHDKSDPTGVMDPTRNTTYTFLDGVFGEMARLFPDEYFHIGGDEVPASEWNSQPKIKAFMKAHKLANAAALQAYFNTRLQKIIAKHGKKMVGWDEILAPNLPKTIMIQSWRGPKSLAQAAREGYPGILSAGYYLDLMQPASQHYAVDPLAGEAANLTPEEQKRILGGEAAQWEELVTPETLDAKLWPRLAAIAERLWSPQNVTDTDSMYARLDQVSTWLEWIGLTHRSNLELMRRRLAGNMPVEPLNRFAATVEPVKGYERHRSPYGSWMAFNHLVDAIPPESEPAREFNVAVDRYLAAPAADAARLLRAQLANWSIAAAEVRPLMADNSLLHEDLPAADSVQAVCKAGMEALGYASRPAPEGWKQRTLDGLKEAETHHAALLIPFAPAVEKLVQAVR